MIINSERTLSHQDLRWICPLKQKNKQHTNPSLWHQTQGKRHNWSPSELILMIKNHKKSEVVIFKNTKKHSPGLGTIKGAWKTFHYLYK